MKKLLLTLSIVILQFCSVYAQEIPNFSFENWSGNRPTNWETTNGLMSSPFNNPQTIFQSTDAYSGAFACEIQTKKMRSKPSGVFVPDYAGSMFVGKQISIKSFPGFPFSYRPKSLQFYYKYNARNNDSATIYTILTRWNTTANKRDTLAQNFELITDSVYIYTKREIVLNYSDTIELPDTAILFITSATSNASAEGARLLIDDLKFRGGTVGFNALLENNSIELYPNPSNGNFFFQFGLNQEIEYIEIRNLEGKQVSFKRNLNTIEVNESPGIYFLMLQTERGKYSKTFIVY